MPICMHFIFDGHFKRYVGFDFAPRMKKTLKLIRNECILYMLLSATGDQHVCYDDFNCNDEGLLVVVELAKCSSVNRRSRCVW